MRRLAAILFVTILALAAASCGDKKLDAAYDRQESDIEDLISNLTRGIDDATVEHNNGVTRVTVAHGDGEALDESGAVAFYYAGYVVTGKTLSNSNLFATNYEVFANSARWALTDSSSFEIATVRLGEDDLVEGLRKGLPGVKGGDECYVLFSGKLGFGKKKTGIVPPNAALAYHLWIKSVSND